MTKLPTAAFLAMLVAGCSTVNHWTEFGPNFEQAYLLVVAENLPVSEFESVDYTFAKVDLATQTRLNAPIFVNFDPVERFGSQETISLDSDELPRPERMETFNSRFGGKFGEPGDYMLTLRHDENVRPFRASENTLCFGGETLVFRLLPGTVNIVPLGRLRGADPVDRDAIQRDAVGIISGYPGMTAPVEFAEVVAVARFESREGLLGPVCGGDDSFTVVSDPSVTASAAPPPP